MWSSQHAYWKIIWQNVFYLHWQSYGPLFIRLPKLWINIYKCSYKSRYVHPDICRPPPPDDWLKTIIHPINKYVVLKHWVFFVAVEGNKVMRGSYNVLENAWCYEPLAVLKCEKCSGKLTTHADTTYGSTSTVSPSPGKETTTTSAYSYLP